MPDDPKSESQNPALRAPALFSDKERRLIRKCAFDGFDAGTWNGPDGRLLVADMLDDLKRFVARTFGRSGRDVSEWLVGVLSEIEAAWKRKRGIERAPNPWAGDRRISR